MIPAALDCDRGLPFMTSRAGYVAALQVGLGWAWAAEAAASRPRRVNFQGSRSLGAGRQPCGPALVILTTLRNRNRKHSYFGQFNSPIKDLDMLKHVNAIII